MQHNFYFPDSRFALWFFIIVFCSISLFTGCSSVYTIHDFSTKEKFNADCVSAISGRRITVSLTNDSSFSTKQAALNDDTLTVFSGYRKKTEFRSISVHEIKDIVYETPFLEGDSSCSAELTLNSGEKLSLENLRFSPEFALGNHVIPAKIPVENIKTISYKIHSRATIGGVLAGAACTLIVSALLSKQDSNNSGRPDGEHSSGPLPPGTICIGGIIGGVVGWFIGNDKVYQFR